MTDQSQDIAQFMNLILRLISNQVQILLIS